MAKNVRGEILHLEREQVRAINRGDVQGALKLFDRGFVGLSSTRHQRIRGLGALRKTFDYYLKRAPKLAYHLEQPHVSVSGGTAVATFYWSVHLSRGHKIHGRGTHVFRNRARNGRWCTSIFRVRIERAAGGPGRLGEYRTIQAAREKGEPVCVPV